MNQENNYDKTIINLLIIVSIFLGLFAGIVSAADPGGPDSVTVTSNTTKAAVGAVIVNISGGYIAAFELNATVQDVRWKAFVGNVSGSFSLQDNTGARIYDWSFTTLSGRIYTTRNSSTVTWASINCSNISLINDENIALDHSNVNDNLNITFNYSAGATHNAFYAGTKYIAANSCPTLNTYVNNGSQDSYFQEMALNDGTNMVYATIISENQAGYNGNTYDFQMIVPENGSASFTGATAYYLYVEIGT